MISLEFSRDEWAAIANTLLEYGYNDDRLNEWDYMILNIVDEIEGALND